MSEEYNIAVLSVIELIVENNAGCVARKLKTAGYETKNFVPVPELKSALYQLQTTNRKLFFEIMKACDWNHGNNNWTNSPVYRDRLISAVGQYTGKKVDKTNWWIATINYIETQK